jgi:hypothetical protein
MVTMFNFVSCAFIFVPLFSPELVLEKLEVQKEELAEPVADVVGLGFSHAQIPPNNWRIQRSVVGRCTRASLQPVMPSAYFPLVASPQVQCMSKDQHDLPHPPGP